MDAADLFDRSDLHMIDVENTEYEEKNLTIRNQSLNSSPKTTTINTPLESDGIKSTMIRISKFLYEME